MVKYIACCFTEKCMPEEDKNVHKFKKLRLLLHFGVSQCCYRVK